MKYTDYKFIFPPRVEVATPWETLKQNDRYTRYVAQPKLNGDCMLIFTNGTETIIKHRDGEDFKKAIKMRDKLEVLHKGSGWMVLVGEHMIKNKKGPDGKPFNEKFVIHDILVYNGVHLLGKTFGERIQLLDELYGTTRFINDPWLYATEFEDVFRVRTFMDCKQFLTLFREIIKIDMYEGFVLKVLSAELLPGRKEKNNETSLAKIRKPTKMYNF